MREKVERRSRLAADFKAKLLAELGPGISTASRDALTSAAISAFVQMTELTATFLGNRASPRDRRELGLARSELRRCLRSLGLIADRSDNDDDAPVPSVQDLIARYDKSAQSGGAA
jgi:hypothetical protein